MVLLVFNNCAHQKNIPVKNDLSFLLGLMGDYGGRQHLPNHPEDKYRITYFFADEVKALERFKLEIINAKLDINKFEFKKKDGFTTSIFSKEYVELFNSYYKFNEKKYFMHYDEALDKEFKVINGKFKKDVFENKIQKINFLKGCLVKSAQAISEDVYELSFVASRSKHILAKKVCKDLNLEIVKITNTKDIVPGGTRIVFKPNQELKLFFENSSK